MYNVSISVHDEFERAMRCPDVESERRKLEYRLHEEQNTRRLTSPFCTLKPSYDWPMTQELTLQVRLNRQMLAVMAGNMDEVVNYVGRFLSKELCDLYHWYPKEK